MLDTLTLENFQKAENQCFTIRMSDGSTVETHLIDVRDMGSERSRESDRRTPFSLIFRGPREPVLAQQILDMENQTLGALSIFLVPVGPDEHGMRYEAVFA